MFARHTVLAMVALATVDEGVTEREKDALRSLLSGRVRRDGASSKTFRPRRPYTYAQAAEELGVSVKTVKRMASSGRLAKVIGTGRKAVGVTADSVERMQDAR